MFLCVHAFLHASFTTVQQQPGLTWGSAQEKQLCFPPCHNSLPLSLSLFLSLCLSLCLSLSLCVHFKERHKRPATRETKDKLCTHTHTVTCAHVHALSASRHVMSDLVSFQGAKKKQSRGHIISLSAAETIQTIHTLSHTLPAAHHTFKRRQRHIQQGRPEAKRVCLIVFDERGIIR